MFQQWKQDHAEALIKAWLRVVKCSTIYRMMQHRFVGSEEWQWYAERAIEDLESNGEIARVRNTIQLSW
jgi:hypothetical protein